MKFQFMKGALMIGLLLALTIRELEGQSNCASWTVNWQSDGTTNVSYVSCQSCPSNNYRFKNATIILPVSAPQDTYDCALCHINCTSCSGSSTNCLTCTNFRYLATDNTCQLCSQLVNFCTNCTLAGGCTRCTTNFKLYETRCIFDCVPNYGAGCLTCTSVVCLTCEPGYVVDLTSAVLGCLICSSLPNCQTCSTGPICLTCLTNFYLDVSNGNMSCVVCSISNCQTCTDGPKCTLCQPGYHLVLPNNLTCQPCSSITNCQTCTDGIKCAVCNPGFSLALPNNLSCIPCTTLADCQTCADGPKCAVCRPTYYLVLPGNLSCISCSSITDCEICIDGPQCMKCPTNYILSSSGGNSACIQCPFGTYASSSINQCLPCASHCLRCQQTSTGVTCIPCPINTVLDVSAQACLRCDTNIDKCAVCSSVNVCTQCFRPYLLDDTLLCNRCEPGFQYIDQHCVKPIGCRSLLPDSLKCLACDAKLSFMYDSVKNTCNCLHGRYVINLNGSNVCLPKCGDGILISPNEQCDDGNIRNQDGCNDNCQLQPNFDCSSDSPSKCKLPFTPILFEYNYAYRYEGTSRCRFSLTLQPSHPSLKYVDWASYLTFNISQQDIVKDSKLYAYNELTNQITIQIEYLRTLENMFESLSYIRRR